MCKKIRNKDDTLCYIELGNNPVVPIDLLGYGYPSVGKYVDLGEDKRKFPFKEFKKLIQKIDTTINN